MKLRTKSNKKLKLKYSKIEKEYYCKLSNEHKMYIKKYEYNINKHKSNEIPLRFKILNLPINNSTKFYLINKYEIFQQLDQNSSDYYKYINYFNTLIKIPFNKYHNINCNHINNTRRRSLG